VSRRPPSLVTDDARGEWNDARVRADPRTEAVIRSLAVIFHLTSATGPRPSSPCVARPLAP